MYITLKDNLKKINVLDNIFNVKFNKTLIHQVYVSYLSNIRQNTKFNKNRSNVAGSNKKQWKQKGTGRARAGSLKNPIWRSGGVTFGSQIRSYKCKVNKKMHKIACRSVISKFLNDNKILVFNEFKINNIKTKELYEKVYKYCKNNKSLILINKYDDFIFKSSRNIYFLEVKSIFNINLISIINFDYIILNKETLINIEKILL